VFDKTAYKLTKIQYSVESLYFSPYTGAYPKDIDTEIKYLRLFSFPNRAKFVLEMMPKMTSMSRGMATLNYVQIKELIFLICSSICNNKYCLLMKLVIGFLTCVQASMFNDKGRFV
jgi:hypothetical protein